MPTETLPHAGHDLHHDAAARVVQALEQLQDAISGATAGTQSIGAANREEGPVPGPQLRPPAADKAGFIGQSPSSPVLPRAG
ncbi:hypothetical protein [Ideonella alba]|uniref:Uncharacterized protein n=1 Tax=Ideonella alba TaxID=2824118 RepID=A0A940Y9E3_9BURK|nr:hypothetical protein [Ideonella alba]MBQ0932362.1 hypothetical protein [Ideonella alba]